MTGVAADAFRGNDVRNTISLDQEAASRLGTQTRHPCLVLGAGGGLSSNRKGVTLPAEGDPASVFRRTGR